MCGLTGIWSRRLSAPSARDRVAAMTFRVRHRGPDDEGINLVADPGADPGKASVVFGHRRLSILDLSAAGHQPMRDPETNNWITYNGEIYNFPDLRRELEQAGHHFRTRCDTEVILKAYAEWGGRTWARLRGMFAFALWDADRRQLHLVRDHLGIKPLYFANTAEHLVFASEVRAILGSGLVERRLSLDGLESYLAFGSVQEPCTMVKGIESMLPGHHLCRESTGRTTVEKYWSVVDCLRSNAVGATSTARISEALQDSVTRQLISDVPVGVFLSGGIDSTAVAALAARAQPGQVRTFCIGSEDEAIDESREASETADRLRCQHTTLVLEGRMVQDNLERALGSYDQPSTDGINTYFISLLVRNAGIKVALSGLGGDELFFGYAGFQKAVRCEKLSREFRRVPAGLRTGLSALLGRTSRIGDGRLGLITELLRPDLCDSYFASRILFSRPHIRRLLETRQIKAGFPSAWEDRQRTLANDAWGLSLRNKISFYELQCYMLSTLLRDSDQMSMAHGLELRVPFVDPRLVESVLPIAAGEKFAAGVNKRLLVEALRGILPPEVAGRRKRGFGLPFRDWLLRDLRETVAAQFSGTDSRAGWDRPKYRQLWSDFQRGRISWSRIFSVFVLERWLQQNDVAA